MKYNNLKQLLYQYNKLGQSYRKSYQYINKVNEKTSSNTTLAQL